MKTRRRRLNSVFFLFLSFSFFVFLANLPTLQAAQVIQIDPAKVRLFIPPGSTKTGTIKMHNPSSETKRVKIYTEDWKYLPVCDGTKDFKPPGTFDLSAAGWVSFVPSEVTIPALGGEVMHYTVKVPSDAKGGHYAVFFFESYLGEPKAQQQEGVTLNVAIRVASLFYVESEGTVIRKATIEDLKIEEKQGKFYLTAKFSNNGNVDITTKGNFFIIDRSGMVYARGEFNDLYTFPGDSANLIATWKESIPKGTYDLVLSIDIGRSLAELGLGRGPVLTKEMKLEIGANGEVVKIGEHR